MFCPRLYIAGGSGSVAAGATHTKNISMNRFVYSAQNTHVICTYIYMVASISKYPVRNTRMFFFSSSNCTALYIYRQETDIAKDHPSTPCTHNLFLWFFFFYLSFAIVRALCSLNEVSESKILS